MLTVRPEGRVSLKETPVKVVLAFEFAMLKLKLVVPFKAIVEALKFLLIEGGAT